MASLVVDVPSQAHWMSELTKYDFGGAAAYLIASVPGIHSYRSPQVSKSMHMLLANECTSWSSGVKLLGSVEASVVGISHLFHSKADSNGKQLKKLATFLGSCHQNLYGRMEVILKRNRNIPADANAVSVLVPNPDDFPQGDCVQLGFLPRNVAKWFSPLCDSGLISFSGYISSKEALAAALGECDKKVPLTLQLSQGPSFRDLSKMMQPEHITALCSLIASIQRCVGLWRLEEVVARYKWPEFQETDFVYGSSSIGAVNAQFLAAFSAASGKRSFQFSDSEESDPEWGCWSASQESKSPSIRIIFPTIERVRKACNGILPSRRVYCFSEKTWQRLRNVSILHDAIPRSHHRVGHPMHVKVALRRFQSRTDKYASGWVYCGSHNFSEAAWGRTISSPHGLRSNGSSKSSSASNSKLHICNFELGIIFVFPPTDTKGGRSNSSTAKLDDIVLPFVVPSPKYGPRDRPATQLAMREALSQLYEQEREILAEAEITEEIVEDITDEEEEVVEATDYVAKEKDEENAYAEILWSQVDSASSQEKLLD